MKTPRVLMALAAAMDGLFQTKKGVVRMYDSKKVGLVARFPRDPVALQHAAQAKRDRRGQHRLNTWTGVRHDTPHVPSTVVKLEPMYRGPYIRR